MKESELSKQTLRHFSESGLTKDHAIKMKIKDVTSREIKSIFPKLKNSREDLSAYEIPYLDLSGKPTGFSRYRLHCTYDSLPKYLQPTGKKSQFYFPPFMDWKKISKDPTIPIYITEGERKSAKACVAGYTCIGLGGVWNWRKKDDEDHENSRSQIIKDFQLIEWRGRKVTIVFDSDTQFNTNVQEAIRKLRNELVNLGADPYRVDLPHKAGSKTGLDDFLKKPFGKTSFDKLPQIPLLLNKTMTGKELISKKFPPQAWIVKGLIPTGLTIFAGPPKVGKSWMVLEILLATASGKKVFGHYEVEKTKCLYLALEDSPRRLKDRILKLSSIGHQVNEFSNFAHEWERVDDGGLLALERRLDAEPDCKVVFIDTFQKVRPPQRGREDPYRQDYEAVSTLKRIADSKGIGIVVVHHTNKGEKADFLESVSGTMGITGAADTIIVLRRGRNDNEGIMEITGRDVREQAIALTFNEGIWTYKGEASSVHATETQQEILDILKTEGRPLRQKEMADLSGRKNGGFGKTLQRMVKSGLIIRKGYLYTLPDDDGDKTPLKFSQNPNGQDKEN